MLRFLTGRDKMHDDKQPKGREKMNAHSCVVLVCEVRKIIQGSEAI